MNVIGESSTVMPRRLYPWTPQILEVRRLTSACLWIVIMQGGKCLTDWKVVSWYIHVNTALVQWFSKKQSIVETSVFGAEFVAMKQSTDALRGLRYKLRMMDIPISGPLHIYWNNTSLANNTPKPESVLRKKSNSVCYHAVCELFAMGESLVGHIPSKENVADLMTKVLYGQKGEIFGQ